MAEEEVIIGNSVEPSIVVGDDSIKIIEPKVEREVLVPMRSKLNLGGNEAVGFEVAGGRRQVVGMLRGSSVLGDEKSKINIGGNIDGED